MPKKVDSADAVNVTRGDYCFGSDQILMPFAKREMLRKCSPHPLATCITWRIGVYHISQLHRAAYAVSSSFSVSFFSGDIIDWQHMQLSFTEQHSSVVRI